MSQGRTAGGHAGQETRNGEGRPVPVGQAPAGQESDGAAQAGREPDGQQQAAREQANRGPADQRRESPGPAGQQQAVREQAVREQAVREQAAREQAAREPAAALAIDATRLRVVLARLARRLRRHELAGLTPTQLSALATVDKAGPLRLGDLAAAEGIAPSTLTRLVTALEEAGYVQRYAVPADARASTLQITPDGRAVLHRIRDESTTILTGMLMLLTAPQRASIAAALPALEQLAGAGPTATVITPQRNVIRADFASPDQSAQR